MLLTNIGGESLHSIVSSVATSGTPEIAAETFLSPSQSYPRAGGIEKLPTSLLVLTRNGPSTLEVPPSMSPASQTGSSSGMLTPMPTPSASEPVRVLGQPTEAAGVLLDYEAYLQATEVTNALSIPFGVSLGEVATNPAALCAVSMHVLLPAHIAAISVPLVPVLSRGTPASLSVTVRAIEPLPFALAGTAEFSLPDGASCTCPLPTTAIPFVDLCLETPVPREHEPHRRVFLDLLFSALWDKLDGHGDGDNVSVRALSVPAAKVTAALQRSLGRFCTSLPPAGGGGGGGGGGSGSETSTASLLFWLPPSTHALVRLTIGPDLTVAKIASENAKILPHVESLLGTTLVT
jgi:hypothetical protein